MNLGQRFHCFFFILNSILWIYVLQENIENLFFPSNSKYGIFYPKMKSWKSQSISVCLRQNWIPILCEKCRLIMRLVIIAVLFLALPHRCGGYVCTRAHIIFIHFIYTQKAHLIFANQSTNGICWRLNLAKKVQVAVLLQFLIFSSALLNGFLESLSC